MRVIGGSARGTTLKGPPDALTRATADKVRGAIFNILAPYVEGARVLDLYAGTGALGLEALSRGARHAVFVEQHGPTLDLLRANARELGLSTQAQLVRARVLDWLAGAGGRFGWIFLDPPYASEELPRALALIAERSLLSDEGLVIAEHDSRAEPVAERLALLERRRYGQTAVSFFTRGEEQ